MTDIELKTALNKLDDEINNAIDNIIPMRDNCQSVIKKRGYRKTGKRLEAALGSIKQARWIMFGE